MDRLTSKECGANTIILCGNSPGVWDICEGKNNVYKIHGFAADKLAAYEDTGLTPEEIERLKPQNEETFIEHLNSLCDIKDKQIAILQALCEDMENTTKEYRAFKEFFDGLYGRDLTVGNWHLNGALEPFDNFYDKAVEEMMKERKNNGRNS